MSGFRIGLQPVFEYSITRVVAELTLTLGLNVPKAVGLLFSSFSEKLQDKTDLIEFSPACLANH